MSAFAIRTFAHSRIRAVGLIPWSDQHDERFNAGRLRSRKYRGERGLDCGNLRPGAARVCIAPGDVVHPAVDLAPLGLQINSIGGKTRRYLYRCLSALPHTPINERGWIIVRPKIQRGVRTRNRIIFGRNISHGIARTRSTAHNRVPDADDKG